jgi:hypothetical protein
MILAASPAGQPGFRTAAGPGHARPGHHRLGHHRGVPGEEGTDPLATACTWVMA